jgi:serine/threonine protein kinase
MLGSFLERGKELLDKGKELGIEVGRGIAGGHKPQLVDVEGRNLMLISLIAEGGYAYVHLARDTSTGDRFAVKRAICQDRDSAAIAEAELNLLRSLPQHPNIIQIFGATTRQLNTGRGVEFLYVLELCKGGSLAKHVTPRSTGGMSPKLREPRILQHFLDACKGVAHMHAQQPPIAHRDLKLENVLVTERGVCKLCDFGSATTHTLDTATASRKERLDEEDLISRYTTAWNRSPEMIDLHRGQRIDEKVDVWALGCLLYTLAFQRHPFDSESPLQILNCKCAPHDS